MLGAMVGLGMQDSYRKRKFDKALTNTLTFVGQNKKTIIPTFIFYFVGIILLGSFTSLNVIIEKLFITLCFPVVSFVGMFIWSYYKAPESLLDEADAKFRKLEKK